MSTALSISDGEPVVLCTPGNTVADETLPDLNLVGDHCYTLVGIVWGTYEGTMQYLYQLRNPWGHNPDATHDGEVAGGGIVQVAFVQIQNQSDTDTSENNFDGIIVGTN